MAKRIEKIAAFMERIAPSEHGAVAAVSGQDVGGPPAIVWNLLPANVVQATMFVTSTGGIFTAVIRLGDVDRFTDPVRVATGIHTDDEIARKILVFGAEFLDDLRSGAIENDAFDEAKAITYYRGLILDGLRNWGAGQTPGYAGPSPKLHQSPPPSEPPVNAHDAVRLAGHPVAANSVKEAKNNAIFWIGINILMVSLAGYLSFMSYGQAADGGGSYYIWWGPIAWGAINIVRFVVRIVRLRAQEREAAAR